MKIKRKIYQSEMNDITIEIRMVERYLENLRDLLTEKKLNENEINNTLAVAGITLNNLAHQTMTVVRSVGKEKD